MSDRSQGEADKLGVQDQTIVALSTMSLTNTLKKFGVVAKQVSTTLKSATDGKVTKALKNFGKMFKSMAKAQFQAAGMQMLMAVIAPLVDLFMMFMPIFEVLGALLQAFFLPVMEALMPVILFITNAIMALIPFARALMRIIIYGLVEAFKFLWNLLILIGKFLVDVFVGFWQVLWGILTAIGDFIINVFIGVWNAIIFVFDIFGAILKGFVNFVIGIINFLGNLFTFGLFADIPYLAEGGIAVKPTLAMIGEAGPEAIVPLGSEGMGGGLSDAILMDINDNLVTQNQMIRRQSRGIQRGRFGR